MHTGVEKVGQRRSRIAWGHWALTNSRPSANVMLIILRVADLAAALFGEMRVSARWGGRVRTKAFLTTLRPC